MNKKIEMTKRAFIKEHKKLLRILKSGSRKDLLEEYKEQRQELMRVLKKNNIS